MSESHDTSSREKPARRRLLKVLASGSGAVVGMKTLPAHWTQPVLDSVALPAHAQTSPDLSLSDPCGIDMQETEGNLVFSVSGAIVGGGDLGGIQIDIEGVFTDGGSPSPFFSPREETVFTAADGTYGPVEIATIDASCIGEVPQLVDGLQVTVTSPDPRLAGQTAICTQEFVKEGCTTPD